MSKFGSIMDKKTDQETLLDERSSIESGLKESGNGKVTTMEREAKGYHVIILYSATYIVVDLAKQVSTYGMKYLNNNVYPIPQTQAVFVTEVLKFLLFFIILIFNRKLFNVRISLYYLIPSLIYAINNNVYYAALRFTTPPIWNIIIQLRIPITGLAYHYIFKRKLAAIQWLALVLLMVAIIFTNFADSGNAGVLEGNNNMLIALTLAFLGSILSVTGTVTMEFLFKNDKRPFSEMQLQLYLFGMIMSYGLYFMETWGLEKPGQLEVNEDKAQSVYALLVTAVVMSIGVGVGVAVIVKRLDNIVKLYTQALANMFTSGACAMLFPDRFQVTLLFVVCLAQMLVAISLYENETLKSYTYEDFLKKPELRSKFLIGCIISPLALLGGMFLSSSHGA